MGESAATALAASPRGMGACSPRKFFKMDAQRCVFVHFHLDLGRFADGRICTVFSVY